MNLVMRANLTILGIAGSLCKDSYNRAALRASQGLAPPAGVRIDTFDLRGIPPYDQDEESTPPERVSQFKAAIRAADAILLVTPEYTIRSPACSKILNHVAAPRQSAAEIGSQSAAL